jgi:hypothetical protein
VASVASGAWLDFCIGSTMLRCGVLSSKQEERSIPMFNLIKSLKSLRKFPSIADMERSYLESSISLVDLERRQREIDGGLFRKSSFDF